jgi:hypothetical protein
MVVVSALGLLCNVQEESERFGKYICFLPQVKKGRGTH